MPEINLIGFDGPEAHSVIYWQIDGENHSKTVCYSAEEEREALDRFYTAGDFYSFYAQAIVVNVNGHSSIYSRINENLNSS
jgi:hypothetical protein